MTSREVLFLISKTGAILYSDAGDTPLALPDSRTRWSAIWAFRDELAIVAHSHPVGPADFSAEDRSTMKALDEALGRSLTSMVIAPAAVIASTNSVQGTVEDHAWWVALLKLASAME